MRRWVQATSALLQNAYWAFPWTRTIYQGPLKKFCTPGLNCYSCPAAVLACPLGTLQHFLAGWRPALRWGTYRLGFYVFGFLAAVGLLGGRAACGWLCPFGFLQEGLHRIPSPKFRVPRILGGLRYAVLAVFAVGLPLFLTGPLGYGEPWFCRAICPAGTLEAGGLFFLMPALREQIGLWLWIKIGLLAGVLGWAVVAYRPYCRTLCPLGALYGMLNRWSLLRVDHDPDLCTECGRCIEACRVGLDPRREPDRAACLRCLTCATRACPTGALSAAVGSRRLERRTPCVPPSTPGS